MTDIAIQTRNLTKDFNIYTNNVQKLTDVILGHSSCKTKRALDDISLTVERGERIAIIGNLGAGRTTFMRSLAGIVYPTEGSVSVNGDITFVADLRAGFDLELTGRENLRTKAAMMGYSKKETAKVEDWAIKFSELEGVIDLPLKSYRVGYGARLAFGVYFARKPDILLIDDPIAVGDRIFKMKCIDRMAEVTQDKETTVIVASNHLPTINRLCTRGLVMDEGKIRFDGSLDEALAYFRQNVKVKQQTHVFEKETQAEEEQDDDMFDF